MICSDTHVHTTFSHDASGSPEEMILAAIEKGLERICFTDHYDKDNVEWGYEELFEPKPYFEKLTVLKEKYSSQIQVNIGIELGMRPYLGSYYQKLLKDYPFDQAIGSVHNVFCPDDSEEGRFYTDPGAGKFFAVYSDEEGFRIMFEMILENIRAFRDFDTLGHLDYVVRYGKEKDRWYSYKKNADVIDEILRFLIENGKALEINSGALTRGLDFPHPHIDVLKRYRELGGEMLTVGSDAHRTEHVAYGFQYVSELLKSCGFEYYVDFKDRKAIYHKL